MDVIAAIATPPGESAVGLLRLSGDGCLALAERFIRWHPRGLSPRVATLASALDGEALVDRVLATFFPGPNSYTGEDLLEIAAHGSPYVLSKLLRLACDAGARPAEPGEFTHRAFLSGRMDLSQAEAICALIRSRTEAAHRVALRQAEGGLGAKLAAVKHSLLAVLANVEAALDNPDEGVAELEPAPLRTALKKAHESLLRLAASYESGKLALEGARVALIGAPNAGKSSLLNALLGKDRAIVAETPGTTRDTIEEPADLHGSKAILIDTAGLRESPEDPVEREGIARTRRALESCDLEIFVLDASRQLSDAERKLLDRGAARARLLVWNKMDLVAGVPPKLQSPGEIFPVSAKTGKGVDRLARAIARASAPASEDSVALITLRQRRCVESAQQSVAGAIETIEQGELAAVRLREALSSIAEIAGETTSDDVLRAVFSNFCVGK